MTPVTMSARKFGVARRVHHAFLELQNAIADAARASGKAKPKFQKSLPADHPAQIALKEAINQRSLEGNSMARLYLHRWVYRCRRTVRNLTSTKEAEYVINNPRAPRRRKGGKQTIRGLGSGAVGEEVSFDPEYKSNLLTVFFSNLFKATDVHDKWPTWVRLEDKFNDKDLRGMPRIDGALI